MSLTLSSVLFRTVKLRKKTHKSCTYSIIQRKTAFYTAALYSPEDRPCWWVWCHHYAQCDRSVPCDRGHPAYSTSALCEPWAPLVRRGTPPLLTEQSYSLYKAEAWWLLSPCRCHHWSLKKLMNKQKQQATCCSFDQSQSIREETLCIRLMAARALLPWVCMWKPFSDRFIYFLRALHQALCDSYIPFLRLLCALSNFLCCGINKELVEIQLLGPLEIPRTKMYRLCICFSPTPLVQIATGVSNLFKQSVAPIANNTEWAARPRSELAATA